MTTTQANPTTTTWTIDPTHTEVGFSVRHLMISTVRGRFGTVSGSVTVDEEHPESAKIDITIDVASVDTRQEGRDNHLRSPDFFDAASYPTIRFVSKRIEGDVTDDFKIVGDLTIRDVTREVTLDATAEGRNRDPWGNERVGFSLSGKLDRTQYGLNWNQALETGGVLVSNDVKLSIDAQFIKQTAA